MSFRTLFLSLLLISIAIAEDSFECTFCNALAENVQTLVGKNEQEILSILGVVSETLCSEFPDKVSPSQCKSGIQLYGPYIVDMLASGIKTSEVCGHIGMCDAPEKFSILWPAIEQNKITYSAKDHLYKSQSQFYKIFLGDSSSLDDETYALTTSVKGFTGTSISIKLTNNADFVQTETCKEGENCLVQTSKPGRNVWCYITLDSIDAEVETDFQLEIVEKNAESEVPVRITRNNTHLIVFVVLISLMTTCVCCFTITKCMFAKKRQHQHIETGNFIMDELIESPPMVMFIPFEGGYIPAYAPVPVAEL